MRIAILASGTRGDIQPMVAVGDELARRGHAVVATVNRNLAGWAAKSGLEVVPFDLDVEAFLKSTEGRRLLARGDLLTFTRTLAEHERSANEALSRACVEASEGADLVVSTILTAFRAHGLAEKLAVPTGCLFTIPGFPTSAFCHPIFPARTMPAGALNRASYDFVHWLWWTANVAGERTFRARLGLPPLSERPRIEDHVAGAVLCSEHVTPRPADWPDRVVCTGFPTLTPELRAKLGEGAPPDGLEAWLDRGDPPVFFGFGSMPVLDPAGMLRIVAKVAARRGVRALVGAGWTDYLSHFETRSDRLFVASALDHDRVLPRCRAAVHHGGAGTTAAALRAGLPSVVASVFGDQPFWGWCVERRGVGVTLPFQELSTERLDDALRRALSPDARRRAKALGHVLRRENGAARAADEVERWARASVRPFARRPFALGQEPRATT